MCIIFLSDSNCELARGRKQIEYFMMLYVGEFLNKSYSNVPAFFQHAILKLPEYKLLLVVNRNPNLKEHFSNQLKQSPDLKHYLRK